MKRLFFASILLLGTSVLAEEGPPIIVPEPYKQPAKPAPDPALQRALDSIVRDMQWRNHQQNPSQYAPPPQRIEIEVQRGSDYGRQSAPQPQYNFQLR